MQKPQYHAAVLIDTVHVLFHCWTQSVAHRADTNTTKHVPLTEEK